MGYRVATAAAAAWRFCFGDPGTIQLPDASVSCGCGPGLVLGVIMIVAVWC